MTFPEKAKEILNDLEESVALHMDKTRTPDPSDPENKAMSRRYLEGKLSALTAAHQEAVIEELEKVIHHTSTYQRYVVDRIAELKKRTVQKGQSSE